MLLNPFTTMLSTTASLTAENTGPGRLTLPGHFGLRCLPAMENGSTGATRAFPSCRAISTLARRTISVWPPRTACGPRCSVPAVVDQHGRLPVLHRGRNLRIGHEFDFDLLLCERRGADASRRENGRQKYSSHNRLPS